MYPKRSLDFRYAVTFNKVMKKVVFVDWYQTLSYSLFWEQLQDPYCINHKYFEVITKWLFVENQKLIEPWMRSETNMETVLLSMSNETSISYEYLFNELKQSCENMTICLPDIANIVYSLQAKGIKVVIATDNMDTFRTFTVPALKLDEMFDDILVSNEQGALKDQPEPKGEILFFDEFLDKNKMTYSDAILLDDSLDLSRKYKQLGFDRIRIKSPEDLRSALVAI